LYYSTVHHILRKVAAQNLNYTFRCFFKTFDIKILFPLDSLAGRSGQGRDCKVSEGSQPAFPGNPGRQMAKRIKTEKHKGRLSCQTIQEL
jgi:hypothetical protein